MEVAVSALRAELKTWIAQARAGEVVVVTDRGVPVARLTGIATADLLTELAQQGLLSPPTTERVDISDDAVPLAEAMTDPEAAPSPGTELPPQAGEARSGARETRATRTPDAPGYSSSAGQAVGRREARRVATFVRRLTR